MSSIDWYRLKELAERFSPLATTLNFILYALALVVGLAIWSRRRLKSWLLQRARVILGKAVPTETIRAVVSQGYQVPEWMHASRNGEPGIQVHARWTFTNITSAPVQIADVYLKLRPRVHGHAMVRHHEVNKYGCVDLMPRLAVPGDTTFFVFPPIRKPGQDLKATVVIVDNLGNEHCVPVIFRGPKGGQIEAEGTRGA